VINIETLFKEQLFYAFIGNGLSEAKALMMLETFEPTMYTRTISPSTLRHINFLVRNIEAYLELELRKRGALNLEKVRKLLNQIPLSKLCWDYAVNSMSESFLEKQQPLF